MLVNDIRRTRENKQDKSLFVALFTVNKHSTPCTILKFSKCKTKENKWDDWPARDTTKFSGGKQDKLQNCFLMENNLILLVKMYTITLLDYNLEQLN